MKKKDNANSEDVRWVVCKEYTNRWGKLMVASEYGYDYWRFLVKTKKG